MSQENFTPGSTRLCKFKKREVRINRIYIYIYIYIYDDMLTSNNQYHQAKDVA